MHPSNKKIPAYLLYILGSLLFISIPIFSSPNFNTPAHLFDIAPFQRVFLSYMLLLLFFYFNYLYLLPKLYFNGKRILFFCIVAVCYFIIAFLPSLIIDHSLHIEPNLSDPAGIPFSAHVTDIMPTGENSALFNFVLILALGYLLKTNQRLADMQSEKLKTEVSYLRAQINPHFLFNTLNSLYALTLEKSDAAPETVLKLSSMMRYIANESNRDSVSLEKEIKYIKDYVSLQQLRMDSNTYFSFAIKGSPSGKSISPLLLIPFIENAFKYGINPEEKSEIAINIDITDDEIVLEISNKKVHVKLINNEESVQGIENTRQRLEYLYSGKHKLLIFDNPHTFTVNLSINLV